ncbi:N-formylglutamate amidohydrolase [Qipengyuania sp. NPDC077563]|uniref:N-formylglutamate amidohydrolase n=1 Tax=Qipengyuania sp. NPDC077563 TaxID=3364497 RepID=UPI00384C9BC6
MLNTNALEAIAMEVGGRISQVNQPAFRYSSVGAALIPVVLSVPHAGRLYPDSLIKKMRDPEPSRLKLEDRMVDKLAIAIAQQTGAAILIADAPRAMIDLNRDVDDVDWGMVSGKAEEPRPATPARRRARNGLGLVPRRLGREEIWNSPLAMDELSTRIAEIHRPYHDRLNEMLKSTRDRFGCATLIDLHSMPPLPRMHDNFPPIEFVLGDRFGGSCHGEISDSVERFFRQARRLLVRNRPYAGGYVLDRHGNPNRMIEAFQLEICRSIYLDAEFANLTGHADQLVTLLTQMVREVAERTIMLGCPPGLEAAQ